MPGKKSRRENRENPNNMDKQNSEQKGVGGVSDILHQANSALFAPEAGEGTHLQYAPQYPQQHPPALTTEQPGQPYPQGNVQGNVQGNGQTNYQQNPHGAPYLFTYPKQPQTMNYAQAYSMGPRDINTNSAYVSNGEIHVRPNMGQPATQLPTQHCQRQTTGMQTPHNNGHECMSVSDDTFSLIRNIGTQIKSMEGHLSKLGKIETDVSRICINVSNLEKDNTELKSKMNELESAMQMFGNIFDEHQCIKEEVSQIKRGNESLLSEIRSLKDENVTIKEQFLEQQCRQMENNLLIFGVPESDGEEPAVAFLNFLTEHVFTEPCDKNKIYSLKFDRIHRLGPVRQRAFHPRPIVVVCQNYSDRELIRRYQGKIDRKYSIREHFPKEIADRRKKLYPVMRRHLADRRYRVRMVRDKLYINNVLYSEDREMEHRRQDDNPNYHHGTRQHNLYQSNESAYDAYQKHQYKMNNVQNDPYRHDRRNYQMNDPEIRNRRTNDPGNQQENRPNMRPDFTTPNPFTPLNDIDATPHETNSVNQRSNEQNNPWKLPYTHQGMGMPTHSPRPKKKASSPLLNEQTEPKKVRECDSDDDIYIEVGGIDRRHAPMDTQPNIATHQQTNIKVTRSEMNTTTEPKCSTSNVGVDLGTDNLHGDARETECQLPSATSIDLTTTCSTIQTPEIRNTETPNMIDPVYSDETQLHDPTANLPRDNIGQNAQSLTSDNTTIDCSTSNIGNKSSGDIPNTNNSRDQPPHNSDQDSA